MLTADCASSRTSAKPTQLTLTGSGMLAPEVPFRKAPAPIKEDDDDDDGDQEVDDVDDNARWQLSARLAKPGADVMLSETLAHVGWVTSAVSM